MKHRILTAFALFLFACDSGSDDSADAGNAHDSDETVLVPGEPNVPFGSRKFQYTEGAIFPSELTEAEQDDAVTAFYDTWKADYVRQGCGEGNYYVFANVDYDGLDNETVSEAHGYGMIIMALMAGHDPEAKTIFDGMFHYSRQFPSRYNEHLMAWYQTPECENAQGDDAATDGDLDIAFALLLADKQWGSCGEIDYLSEAKATIDAILEHEVDPSARWLLMGDWALGSSYGETTRSSDFMPAHLESFAAVGDASTWTGLIDSLYDTYGTIQRDFSPDTGLLPDFVKDPAANPAPQDPDFLEGPYDGAYYYNACRTPWRIGTHFLLSGDDRARQMVEKMTDWFIAETEGDPVNVSDGYTLDGEAVGNWFTMAFMAPLAISAMVDSRHQEWLDLLWLYMVDAYSEGYYGDTIKLMTMITVTENWWAPEAMPTVC